jgi:hypothetical protein
MKSGEEEYFFATKNTKATKKIGREKIDVE